MDFISFGEILFDVFKDEKKLGGAPLNVALHLTKLGAKGKLISALGKDELGKSALKELASSGIDLSLINIVEEPTGRADIVLTNSNADYFFNAPSAWDKIKIECEKLPKKTDLIYFGTLSQRDEISRLSLYSLLDNVKAKEIFYDVNIRKNFHSKEIIETGLNRATILKLNEDELPLILNLLNINALTLEKGAEKIQEQYNLSVILLTLGKRGSAAYDGFSWYKEGIKDVSVVDTVGAGDSLSAGFIYTYLKTKDIQKSLLIGSTIADFVVTQKGANPPYSKDLKFFLEQILN